MKRLISILLTTCVAVPAIAQGSAEVNWDKPEKFRDLRPANETRAGYQKHVLSELQKFFSEKLADRLPDGYKLSVTFTDIDLAGEVWPAFMVGLQGSGDVRLIKHMDAPRLAFNYKLIDASGALLVEGDENIRDMNFLQHSSLRYESDSLKFEKNMLDDWFRAKFKEYLSAS